MKECFAIAKEYEDDFPEYRDRMKTILNEEYVYEKCVLNWKYNDIFWLLAVEGGSNSRVFNDPPVRGFYILQETTNIFDESRIGHELYLFGSKKHPGTALPLLREGIEVAKARNWLWLDNFYSSGYNADRIDILYKRIGAKQIGRIYRTTITP